MMEFEHFISEAEVNSEYINLTDPDGKQYGPQIGKHGDVFRVLDAKQREFEMKRHHGNQLTRCSEWFSRNAIKASTRILVKFDRDNGVLHLLPVSDVRAMRPVLLAAVSFAHNGRHYEVRCTPHGSKVQVRGSVDGGAEDGFEL